MAKVTRGCRGRAIRARASANEALALHGHGSTPSSILAQMEPLRRKVGMNMEAIEGVEEEPNAGKPEKALRWSDRILREGVELPEGLSEEERRNREGTWRYDGVALERSIEKVAGELRERADDNGAPGLVGFSQGANLAAMVASNMQEVNGEADRSPRFIMCFCGVNFSWSSSNAFSATGERRLFDLSSPPDLPALLIVGQEDLQRRNEERFISLFGFDEASQSPARTRSPSGWPVLLVRHSEGHTPLPEDLAERERLLDAVQGFLDEVENLRSGRDVPD